MFVDSYGTGKVSDRDLVDVIRSNFDLRPGVIGPSCHSLIWGRADCFQSAISACKSLNT